MDHLDLAARIYVATYKAAISPKENAQAAIRAADKFFEIYETTQSEYIQSLKDAFENVEVEGYAEELTEADLDGLF